MKLFSEEEFLTIQNEKEQEKADAQKRAIESNLAKQQKDQQEKEQHNNATSNMLTAWKLLKEALLELPELKERLNIPPVKIRGSKMYGCSLPVKGFFFCKTKYYLSKVHEGTLFVSSKNKLYVVSSNKKSRFNEKNLRLAVDCFYSDRFNDFDGANVCPDKNLLDFLFDISCSYSIEEKRGYDYTIYKVTINEFYNESRIKENVKSFISKIL